MPLYQNATVTDAKIEVGNYAIYIGTAGSSAAGITINLGAGMVKSFAYIPEMFNVQAGNAIDPIEGVSRETATVEFDLIEYDGSAFSALSGGLMTGTSASAVVGGQTTAVTPKAIKLVNVRKLITGTTQTTTYVLNKCTLQNGWTQAIKSDNDADPVSVYSFSILAKQYATAQTIYTKTVV